MINQQNIFGKCTRPWVCKEVLYFCSGVLFLLAAAAEPFYICSANAEDSNGEIESTQTDKEKKELEAAILRPKIAIVIDDLGVQPTLAERAIALPNSISLAFLPSSQATPSLAELAIAVGHEVLIHMPMEPLDPSIYPGPGALLLNMTFKEILTQLRLAFTQMPGAVGLNNHMGSKYTGDENGMATVMGELKVRDMIFVDSRTTPETKGVAMAKKRNVRSVSRDVFLDNDRSESAIRKQLLLTEKLAKENGIAVAIGHPYPETFSVLEEWIPNTENRGYVLVPISVLAK